MSCRYYSFVGGNTGRWSVTGVSSVAGDPISPVNRLDIQNSNTLQLPAGAEWILRGVTSNHRYTTKDELEALSQVQPQLNREHATCAALIPIKKRSDWWALPQDTRRNIFESQSRHTTIGMKYLPAIARRLHHCRDLGEPFDFLTWFEFAPSDLSAFDDLVAALRGSEEWTFVEREVDIRLTRVSTE